LLVNKQSSGWPRVVCSPAKS